MKVIKKEKSFPLLTEKGKVSADARKKLKTLMGKRIASLGDLETIEEGSKYELGFKNADGQVVYAHIELKITEKPYQTKEKKIVGEIEYAEENF